MEQGIQLKGIRKTFRSMKGGKKEGGKQKGEYGGGEEGGSCEEKKRRVGLDMPKIKAGSIG